MRPIFGGRRTTPGKSTNCSTVGAESRLTPAEGLDDGPEYPPDGQYLYFHSVRSGSMRITADEGYNNWLAHVSPDGTRIAFLPSRKMQWPINIPPTRK